MDFVNEQSGKFMQRFTDVNAEPRQMLPPIMGYEKMPLVSLEQAVDPLLSEIPDVHQMVKNVMRNRRTPTDGLTLDESGSIMLYSLEWKPRDKSFYYTFNAALRAMDRNKLKPWFLYLKLLIYSLSKLPVVSQTIYRGVKADLHELYPQNSTCIWWGFSSCTSSMKVLQVDEFLGQKGTRTMFHIESTSGKSISQHSAYPQEEEVLLPPARLFQVVSSFDAGDGLHMIQLKEIQPKFPLIEPLPEETEPIPLDTAHFRLASNVKWAPRAEIVAGGNGQGNGPNQLNHPCGFFVDNDEKMIYIADTDYHRIVAWRIGDDHGQVIIGHHGRGQALNQLDLPTDILFDKRTNSFVICDNGNRRIMRWSRDDLTTGQVLIDNMICGGLTIDYQGNLYVIDVVRDEVRRVERGKNESVVVAGGHGRGNRLNQLNSPHYLFVDQAQSVFISDHRNHRVVKWRRNAVEGIVVAGGNGMGKSLKQLSNPQSIYVDSMNQVYVADSWNHRIMRWSQGETEGHVLIEGKGKENKSHQLFRPRVITFDRDGNLYVLDHSRHQVQRFSIETSQCHLS